METKKTQAQIDLRKAETELAETPEPQKATPKDADDFVANPEVQDKLTKEGFNKEGMATALKNFFKGTLTSVGTAIGGAAIYEAVRDPEGAGAALARDTAMEAALLAAKAPAALAMAAAR